MIGSAIQKGSWIYVYDERGNQKCCLSGDALLGFTGTSVTIRKGSFAYTYDERGSQQYCKSL